MDGGGVKGAKKLMGGSGKERPYPSAQDLVDGCALLQRALSHHLGPHLLHVQHERIERLLDVGLLLLLLLHSDRGFPAASGTGGQDRGGCDPIPVPGATPSRPHSRAAAGAGAGLGRFLLHDGRDDGGVRDARGVQPVGGRRDHVRGEAAGHQAAAGGAGAPSAPHGCQKPGSTPNPPENLRRRLWEHQPQPAWGLLSRESPPVLAAWYPSPGGHHSSPTGTVPRYFWPKRAPQPRGQAVPMWRSASTHGQCCCGPESHIILRKWPKPCTSLGTPKGGPLSLPRATWTWRPTWTQGPTWTWRRSWRGLGRGAESHRGGWSTRAVPACKHTSLSRQKQE